MSKMSDLAMRAELSLMGKYVPLKNNEVQLYLDYVLSALSVQDKYDNFLKEHIQKYSPKNEVVGTVCNVVCGMRMITFAINTNDGETPEPFKEDYGTGCPCAFSYVLNVDSPFCSEFGDVFFEKKSDGYYHRAS